MIVVPSYRAETNIHVNVKQRSSFGLVEDWTESPDRRRCMLWKHVDDGDSKYMAAILKSMEIARALLYPMCKDLGQQDVPMSALLCSVEIEGLIKQFRGCVVAQCQRCRGANIIHLLNIMQLNHIFPSNWNPQALSVSSSICNFLAMSLVVLHCVIMTMICGPACFLIVSTSWQHSVQIPVFFFSNLICCRLEHWNTVKAPTCEVRPPSANLTASIQDSRTCTRNLGRQGLWEIWGAQFPLRTLGYLTAMFRWAAWPAPRKMKLRQTTYSYVTPCSL